MDQKFKQHSGDGLSLFPQCLVLQLGRFKWFYVTETATGLASRGEEGVLLAGAQTLWGLSTAEDLWVAEASS